MKNMDYNKLSFINKINFIDKYYLKGANYDKK